MNAPNAPDPARHADPVREADENLAAAIAWLQALPGWRVMVCPVADWLVDLRAMRQEMRQFDGRISPNETGGSVEA